MQHRILTLLLLCLFHFAGFSQTLKGRVVSGQNGKPLYPVTVVNITSQQTIYTDADGYFSISAKEGEPIAFSFIGYKTLQRFAPAAEGRTEIRVEMLPLSFELEEVIVRPGLTEYQMDSIERRETYSRPLARQKSPILSPFSFVAEKFSKRAKRIYKFQKQFNYWEDQRYIDTRYTPELVSTLTGLKGDSLASFMNAYPMAYDYARMASELELKMWIRTNYKAWLKNPVIIKVADSLIQNEE